MSKDEGKGSILFKLLIVIFAIGLVLIIIIPGQIWDEEELELVTERTNIESIYEAEKFYYKLTNNYTDDPQELLRVINEDSTLQIENSVVNNTRLFQRKIQAYLSNNLVKEILNINLRMADVVSDLESNVRFFKDYEAILNEAAALRLKVTELRTASSHTEFIFCALYLDSLHQLNRNITDYTLQVGTTMALYYADTVSIALAMVNFDALQNEWQPLSARLDGLISNIMGSKIVSESSVADRVEDFKKSVDKSFRVIKSLSIDSEVASAFEIRNELDKVHTDFLHNFLITSRIALVKMPEADSLVLNLTHHQFESPINQQSIKILLLNDSSALKIESPVLLDELKAKAAPVAEKVGNLKFVKSFQVYVDSLKSVEQKALAIRRQMRRNTDLFIGYKTMEDIIKNQIPKLQVYSSYADLNKMASSIPGSESYSEITENLESSLSALNTMKQLLQQNVYGNLDTLHVELIKLIVEFNDNLDAVRRLPKGIQKLESEITVLNTLLQNVKTSGGPDQVSKIEIIEMEVGEHLEFSNTGTEEPVYGIFKKKIINPGYMFMEMKSWEEEE